MKLHRVHSHIVVMGISGCGKSTIGRRLAPLLVSPTGRTPLPFVDADDYRADDVRARLDAGETLTEADIDAWLSSLRVMLASSGPLILACAALRGTDRVRLNVPPAAMVELPTWIYLHLDHETATRRLRARPDYAGDESVVERQCATLEEPDGIVEGIRVVRVDATRGVWAVVEDALAGVVKHG